jgi:hypothetical protein
MTSTSVRKATPAPKKVPTLQVNAVNALNLKPTDLTENGIRSLQGGVVGATAKVALAVFVSPATNKMSDRTLAAFLNVSKGTAGNIKNSGPILARCGAAAADQTVATECLALVAGRATKPLDGKTGARLVKSIHDTYKTFRTAENSVPKRGAGKETAAEKAAKAAKKAERDAASVEKASNTQRIGGAMLFLMAVVKSGATDVTEEQAASLFTIVTEISTLVSQREDVAESA